MAAQTQAFRLLSPVQVLRKELGGTAEVVSGSPAQSLQRQGWGVGAADRGRGRWQEQETETETGTGDRGRGASF